MVMHGDLPSYISLNVSILALIRQSLQILSDSCKYFGNVMIPDKVYEETVGIGKKKGHPDALIIENLIKGELIKIKKVRNHKKVEDLMIFGLHHGEAEAVVLYFREQAQFLATDDDTCRRNRIILGINIIGSPAIVLTLFKNSLITRMKALDCVCALETIGWFDEEVMIEMKRQIEKR